MSRAMREAGVATPIMGVEEPNEQLLGRVGIQDYRDLETRADELASIFSYLYHEYVTLFQSNPRRGNRVWQAHAAADGQMPFLRPDDIDLGAERGSYNRFMRRWVELYRGEGRKFLAYGRQLKPPKVVCAYQNYEMRFFGDSRLYQSRQPTVFVNVYEAADGTRAIVLANATDHPQQVELYQGANRRAITVPADDVMIRY